MYKYTKTKGVLRRHDLALEEYRYMNIPHRFWGANSADVSEAVKPQIHNYNKGLNDAWVDGVSLVLNGPPQSGKTSAASLVLKNAKMYMYLCYFADFWTLLERHWARQAFEHDEDISIMDYCRRVDFLVIDDITIRPDMERRGAYDEIAALIRYRYAWQKPTITTSTLDQSSVADSAATPIFEAMHKSCEVINFPNRGKSFGSPVL